VSFAAFSAIPTLQLIRPVSPVNSVILSARRPSRMLGASDESFYKIRSGIRTISRFSCLFSIKLTQLTPRSDREFDKIVWNDFGQRQLAQPRAVHGRSRRISLRARHFSFALRLRDFCGTHCRMPSPKLRPDSRLGAELRTCYLACAVRLSTTLVRRKKLRWINRDARTFKSLPAI
jgi:hypothetical protein